MQDHLYDFELLLKPASKVEKLAVAQTVSPFDTNAKAQNRKMVSIPTKASGYSGVFWPAFFPSAPEPRKAPWQMITGSHRNRYKNTVQGTEAEKQSYCLGIEYGGVTGNSIRNRTR